MPHTKILWAALGLVLLAAMLPGGSADTTPAPERHAVAFSASDDHPIALANVPLQAGVRGAVASFSSPALVQWATPSNVIQPSAKGAVAHIEMSAN